MNDHLGSKKHKHEVKLADRRRAAESAQFKLIVTFLKREANSEEKKESLVALKKVAGLGFAEAGKLLSSAVKSGDIVLELHNPSMQLRADIDRGNFDTAWLQLRTKTAVPSD